MPLADSPAHLDVSVRTVVPLVAIIGQSMVPLMAAIAAAITVAAVTEPAATWKASVRTPPMRNRNVDNLVAVPANATEPSDSTPEPASTSG